MRTLRKMFGVALLCAAAAAYAVPSFTPVIDGIKDAGWGETPDESSTSQALPTEFNLDGGFYVTDDNEWIYFGFDADPDPWTDAKNPHIHIIMDVGSSAGGGTFAAWGANNVAYTLPFRPEYDIVTQWNTDDQNIQFTGLNTWVINNWAQQPEITTDGGGGGQWTEIAIRRNQLGTPEMGTVLNLSVWLRPAWDTQGGVACLPADANFPTDNGAIARPISQQFAYTVQTAFGDAVAPRLLSAHQIDRRSVELLFDETMNITSLNNSSHYLPYGWPFTGFRYTTDLNVGIWNFGGFVDGTEYSIGLTSGITDAAGNPIDPSFDSVGWTAPTYADVLFRVEDPGMTHDSIWMKGSFNFYHEYDGGWQGGNVLLYDNGTNGDVTAGDHVFSRLYEMVPNGGDPMFEWGCVDEEDNWLLVGPNQTFALPDVNDLTVTYVIPNPTSSDVTVTFRVDIECLLGVDIVPDSVTVAGPFNGWNGTLMTDGDMDNQFTTDVLFPAGSSVDQAFKFRYHVAGETFWENVVDRPLTLDDNVATMDLGNFFWDDWVCAPTNLTIFTDGTDLTLRWFGPEYANFEVWSHTSSENILIDGTLLGSTAAHEWTMPIDANMKYFVVRGFNP